MPVMKMENEDYIEEIDPALEYEELFKGEES